MSSVYFPSEEDFGIVAFEAFASGDRSFAFRGGDIPEHLEEVMGTFFDRQTVNDIVTAVREFHDADYDAERIRRKALALTEQSSLKIVPILIMFAAM